VRQLILQEVQLAKDELHEKVTALQGIAVAFAGAFVVFVIAGSLLIVMGVHLLHVLSELPLWSCYAIVGGALAVFGAFLLAAGKRKLERMTVLPTRTIETVKETMPWMKKAQ
jgi:hypothetical protein